jgi:hypothetical protein
VEPLMSVFRIAVRRKVGMVGEPYGRNPNTLPFFGFSVPVSTAAMARFCTCHKTFHGSSHKAGQGGVHLNMLRCIPYGNCARHVDHGRFSGFVRRSPERRYAFADRRFSVCQYPYADGHQIPACNGSQCGIVLPQVREFQTKASARSCIVGMIRSG